MELEFHQLDLRYRDLRILSASKRRRLMTQLADAGQQTPVLVTATDETGRYVLIDGYLRVTALKRLGRDTVRAVCLDLPEADALVLHRLRVHSAPSALEDGWLLRVLRDTHGLKAAVLATKLSRSPSWVSRRLALVESLSAKVQRLIREGSVCPYAASKYLVPLARANQSACDKLAENIAAQRLSTRQVHALYVGWRQGDGETQQRIAAQPLLYLAAQAEAAPRARAAHPDDAIHSDLHAAEAILRRLARRLRERSEEVPLGSTVADAWSAVQQAFDALFAYLKV